MARTGVLLLNLGGPDSLDAVSPFLYNLFSDPDIIRLPFSEILQKPIAWYITQSRAEEARKNYRSIGGKSPIVPLTKDQAAALQHQLKESGHDLPIYIAMRYWYPFTEEAVSQILADGIERLIVLPLYPHYSLTTTGSSLNELNRVLSERNAHHVEYQVVPPYYHRPEYLSALAETIQEGLAKNPWTCAPEEVQILFSAHSLPKKFVKKTKDAYPDQIYDTCQRLMDNHFPGNQWELSYQSKVGKMPWLGPDTDGVIHYFAAQHIDNVLIVPVSFVSDHIETLYEIDMLYIGVAKEIGITHCYRTEALNSRPTFIQALNTFVTEALELGTSQIIQLAAPGP